MEDYFLNAFKESLTAMMAKRDEAARKGYTVQAAYCQGKIDATNEAIKSYKDYLERQECR